MLGKAQEEEKGREGGREREREREREERQIDRQTDRQSQADRDIGTNSERNDKLRETREGNVS